MNDSATRSHDNGMGHTNLVALCGNTEWWPGWWPDQTLATASGSEVLPLIGLLPGIWGWGLGPVAAIWGDERPF